MCIIVSEGSAPVLVRYTTWREWRSERTRQPLPPAPLAPAGVCFCGMCWGAGRIHEPARNGEGLIPVRCAACAGAGVVGARTA